MNSKKQNSAVSIAAIMSLYLVYLGTAEISPALATPAQHFAGKNITWISTIPSLFLVIGSAVSGAVMGRKIGFRNLGIVSSILVLAGGCAPALFDNYMLLLVCRAVLGFGLGLQAPLENALIIGNFEGQKRAALLGYGTLCMNAGGIIMQLLGGTLASISWQAAFWGHGFAVIALIMAFFIPEPAPNLSDSEAGSSPDHKKTVRASGIVWIIGLVLFIYNVTANTVLITVSQLFESRNAGGAAAAGLSLSLYTLAGCFAGLIFGKLFQIATKWCLSIGYFFCAAGAALAYFGHSVGLMTAGLVLMGFGFAIVFPAVMAWTGMVSSPENAGASSSRVLACMNLGAFVGSFWLILLKIFFENAITANLMFSIVSFAAAGIIFLFRSPFGGKAASRQ
ncbi:MAG: MFS transporter [Lachnospiraceae bacterium]